MLQFSAYSDINASLTENYFAGDKRAALVGADDAILQIFPGMQCSTAPADDEVLVTANIRDWLDVTVGTAIPLTLPDGQTISLTVAGFNEDTSDANQYDAVVLVMNRSTIFSDCRTGRRILLKHSISSSSSHVPICGSPLENVVKRVRHFRRKKSPKTLT